MKKIKFWQVALEDYNEWANTDTQIFRRIAKLIADIQKQPSKV